MQVKHGRDKETEHCRGNAFASTVLNMETIFRVVAWKAFLWTQSSPQSLRAVALPLFVSFNMLGQSILELF